MPVLTSAVAAGGRVDEGRCHPRAYPCPDGEPDRPRAPPGHPPGERASHARARPRRGCAEPCCARIPVRPRSAGPHLSAGGRWRAAGAPVRPPGRGAGCSRMRPRSPRAGRAPRPRAAAGRSGSHGAAGRGTSLIVAASSMRRTCPSRVSSPVSSSPVRPRARSVSRLVSPVPVPVVVGFHGDHGDHGAAGRTRSSAVRTGVARPM